LFAAVAQSAHAATIGRQADIYSGGALDMANANTHPGWLPHYSQTDDGADPDDTDAWIKKVPIPAPLALLVTGLFGLAVLGRRKRKASI